MFSYLQYIIYSFLNDISYFPKYFFLPNLPPRGGFRPAGVEGEEVFGAAIEFCLAAGGFGDFLAEAHVVEAGFDIEDADALRVELAGPHGADFFRVGEVGLDFLEVSGTDACELQAFHGAEVGFRDPAGEDFIEERRGAVVFSGGAEDFLNDIPRGHFLGNQSGGVGSKMIPTTWPEASMASTRFGPN